MPPAPCSPTLAHTGPLTIGEAALHLERAQSVVSESPAGVSQTSVRRVEERRHPEQSWAEVEAATLAHLRSMPAWRDHPRVAGRG